MSTPKRVTPWRTLSIAQGNAIQLGGLLGAAVLAWYAGREGARGTRWIVVSRLLAYFSEHAFSHWLVGRTLGIRFTGYGLHGTSHPRFYPPGVRWVFSHLPLLSARADPMSLRAAAPTARATMYAAGTGGTMLVGLTIPLYAWLRSISGARGLLISSASRCVPAGTCGGRGGRCGRALIRRGVPMTETKGDEPILANAVNRARAC